jgi:hypothetical protein
MNPNDDDRQPHNAERKEALIEEAHELLEDAERDRAAARALRAEADGYDAKADEEILDAERDLERAEDHHGGGNDDHGVKVQFRHLAEHEKASFRVDEDMTLQAIWDQSYLELDITRGDRDVLQAPGQGGAAVSLMEHLALTLKQARHRELCDHAFEIAARTGGA